MRLHLIAALLIICAAASGQETRNVKDLRLITGGALDFQYSGGVLRGFNESTAETITLDPDVGLDASQIGVGTLADDRLSGNVPLLNAASNTFSGPLHIPNLSTIGGNTIASENSVSDAYNTLEVSKQNADADLTALAGLSANGIIARTGSGAAAVRTITGTGSNISVTNGNGVSGNPTIDVGTNIPKLASANVFTANQTVPGLNFSGVWQQVNASESTAARFDFDFQRGTTVNADRYFYFGPATNTGTGTLRSIWYKGDGGITNAAMILEHKTPQLTVGGSVTSHHPFIVVENRGGTHRGEIAVKGTGGGGFTFWEGFNTGTLKWFFGGSTDLSFYDYAGTAGNALVLRGGTNRASEFYAMGSGKHTFYHGGTGKVEVNSTGLKVNTSSGTSMSKVYSVTVTPSWDMATVNAGQTAFSFHALSEVAHGDTLIATPSGDLAGEFSGLVACHGTSGQVVLRLTGSQHAAAKNTNIGTVRITAIRF